MRKSDAIWVVRQELPKLGYLATGIRLFEDGMDSTRRKHWAFDAFDIEGAEPWCVSGYVHADGHFEGPRDDPDALEHYQRD